ncbi:MAG TPA: hypothetical protein VFX21_03715, partial [Acidimicrobiia bacterium]|nr:hypothetical protein [Acidimicrobiia bacterium]
MTASGWYLLVSIWGACFTVMALWPIRRPQWLMGIGFFASWLATELAVIHIVWQVIATIVFIW